MGGDKMVVKKKVFFQNSPRTREKKGSKQVKEALVVKNIALKTEACLKKHKWHEKKHPL